MNLDKEDKILIGVGVASAVAIAAIGLALSRDEKKKPKKKSYGVTVGPQCSTYEFTDEARAKESIEKMIDRAADKGAIDPFTLASAWLRAVAGKCQSYPQQSRNPGEASLYRDAFYEILVSMRARNLLSEQMEQTYQQMVDTWATSQGLEIELA